MERSEPRPDEQTGGSEPAVRTTDRSRPPSTHEVLPMMDVLSLGLTVVFFALSVAFVALCDRL
jgi:hypothetical protein